MALRNSTITRSKTNATAAPSAAAAKKSETGASSSLLSSRLNASERKLGGDRGDASGRPQLIDKNLRNVTPKPLIVPTAKDAERKGTVLAAAAQAVRRKSLNASSASAQSDGDSEDRLSTGFSQSALSERDDDADSGEDEHSEVGINEDDNESHEVFLRDPASGVPIMTDRDVEASEMPATLPSAFAALSLLPSSLFLHGFPTGLPAMQPSNVLTVGQSHAPSSTTASSKPKIPDAVLDALITVSLEETETTILFGMPAVRTLQDSVESREVLAANERYDNLCATISKSGVELYPVKGISTLNESTKNKDVMTVQAAVENVEVQASAWEIDDVQKALRDGIPPIVNRDSGAIGGGVGGMGDVSARSQDHANSNSAGTAIVADAEAAAVSAGIAIAPIVESHVETLVSVSLANPGCLIDVDGSVKIFNTAAAESGTTGGKHGGRRQSIAASGIMQSSALNNSGVNITASKVGNSMGASQQGGSQNWGTESVKSESTGAEMLNSTRNAPVADDHTAGHNKSLDPNAGAADLSSLDINTVRQSERILTSRNLLDSLALMERAVQQNLYHTSHRKYRARAGAELIEQLLEAGREGGTEAAADVLETSQMQAGMGRSPARARRAHTAGGAEDNSEDEEGDHDTRLASSHSRFRLTSGKSTSAAAAAEGKTSSTGDSAAVTTGRGGAMGPGLQKLWSYWCPDVEGLTVSCMAWNKANRDLLAVGYGNIDYDGTSNDPAKTAAIAHAARTASVGNTAGGAASKGGVIALWSISNPEFPQAVLKTPEDISVTALDFSTQHPSLLAAGLGDGTVCVYDVRSILLGIADGTPGLTSNKLEAGAHTEAVWQLKWVTKADSGLEVLVSISTDGRVTQWDCKKALAPSLLMTLKRARAVAGQSNSAPTTESKVEEPSAAAAATTTANTSTTAANSKTAALPPVSGADVLGLPAGTPIGDGILARTASGLTFDFSFVDNTMYFIGTEDGLLARCSTSYSEQYLEVTQAHAGPINRLRLSPFVPYALLTCSADWSIKLWNIASGLSGPAGLQGAASNCITFQVDSVQDAIADIAWSPTVATVFASVTRDGHIQLWDASTLTPLINTTAHLDKDVWELRLAVEEAEKAKAAAAKAAADRREHRLKLGYDEDDDDEDDGDDAFAAKHAESKHDIDKRRASVDNFGDEDATPTNTAQAHQPPPPAKRLTSVLFADTNTQILVTGDTTGRVDVYRIVGLDAVMDTSVTSISSSSGGGVDVAERREEENVKQNAAGLAVGSEAYEAQVSALQTVLNSMNTA